MPDSDTCPELRARIRALQARRRSVESKLLQAPYHALAAVQQQGAAYRAFQQNWKVWRQLSASLEQSWKQLQQAQSR
jgi:hypothetical protein